MFDRFTRPSCRFAVALVAVALVACHAKPAPSGVDGSTTMSPLTDAAAPPVDMASSTPADLAMLPNDAGMSPLVGRPYDMHVPASYDAMKPTALVIMLHGYNSTAALHEAWFKITPVSDAHGFLYAYPDGLKDILGKQGWNASDACCIFQPAKPDDLGYLTAMLDDIEAKYNVDPKRVFVIGHSNGAFMAQALACALSSRIAGVLSQAGAVFADAASCKSTSPIAFRQIHAVNDDTISYDGGKLFFLAAAYPSAHQTVATWAQKDGCSAVLATNIGSADVTTDVAGDDTVIDGYTGCSAGSTVELWTMNGIPVADSHQPPLTAGYAEAAWAFLNAHPKP